MSFCFMTRKKKVQIKPKSELGINKELPICFNCMWRHRDTGFCPMYMEYYDYNHRCPTRKIFRYSFERMDEGYINLHI